jgi:hypothetical protein
MRRGFSDECRRVMRQAVAASAGTFSIAVAIGLGAWAYGAPPGIPSASEFAAAFISQPAVELRASHDRLRSSPREGSLLSIVRVNEQALPTARELDEFEPEEEEEEPQPAMVTAAPTPPPRPPAPVLAAGDRAQATLSFYYCEQGESAMPAGDGGRFCGKMRNGTVVHDGAAACDYAYMGQRFRIEGDPLEREYVCADTGSAVHGLHRDIWFHNSDDGWAWQQIVGQRAVIEIIEP